MSAGYSGRYKGSVKRFRKSIGYGKASVPSTRSSRSKRPAKPKFLIRSATLRSRRPGTLHVFGVGRRRVKVMQVTPIRKRRRKSYKVRG